MWESLGAVFHSTDSEFYAATEGGVSAIRAQPSQESTGALSVAEAWAERDIPWHCGKYFLLFLVGLLFFLFR